MSEPRGVGGEERRQFLNELERKGEHAKRLLDDIERRRQEAERLGLNFTAPTAEQLQKKLASIESPMMSSQWWGNATRGGIFTYNVAISNPDSFTWSSLYVHVFVGLGNIVPDVGDAVSAVDPRFPRLTLPRFPGLSLAPGAVQALTFSIPIPATIERSNYLANAILFQANHQDVGRYFDRGLSVFEVP